MAIEAVIEGIVEVIKLINFYNANLAPEEAKLQTARLARVLDFLFGWLDKHQVQAAQAAIVSPSPETTHAQIPTVLSIK